MINQDLSFSSQSHVLCSFCSHTEIGTDCCQSHELDNQGQVGNKHEWHRFISFSTDKPEWDSQAHSLVLEPCEHSWNLVWRPNYLVFLFYKYRVQISSLRLHIIMKIQFSLCLKSYSLKYLVTDLFPIYSEVQEKRIGEHSTKNINKYYYEVLISFLHHNKPFGYFVLFNPLNNFIN